MAQPNIAQVAIGSNEFRAIGIHFGVSTLNNGAGMPLMGNVSCAILVMVDLNDQINLPFTTLRSLFDLSYGVTREKIQDIVLTFWTDDSAVDVICSYSFRGWISNYVTTTGMGRASSRENDATNHVLTLTLQPELDANNFVKLTLGN